MRLFDCNACFGNEMINHECVNHENFIVLEKVELAKTAKELLEYMEAMEIAKSLVWHKAQYELDATAGNQKLLSEIKGFEERLKPSWTILPDITDEQYSPERLFPEMKKARQKSRA